MPRPHSLQPGGPQANELGTPAFFPPPPPFFFFFFKKPKKTYRPDSEVDLLAVFSRA